MQARGKTAMKDAAFDTGSNWIAWALAGLGVSFAPHEWIGGMFLALAGAAFAMRNTKDAPTLAKVLAGAFIASHLAALVVHRYAPEIPVQIVMALVGLFSQPIMRMAFGIGDRVEKRTDVLADRLIDKVLPSDKGGSDGKADEG